MIKHRNHTSHPNHGQDRPQTDPPPTVRPSRDQWQRSTARCRYRSNFWSVPRFRLKKSERVCTMPSPGFGIKRMSRERAAPTPCQHNGDEQEENLSWKSSPKVPAQSDAKSGICAPKHIEKPGEDQAERELHRVHEKHGRKFSDRRHPPAFFLRYASRLCRIISANTNTEYRRSVVLPKFDPRWWQHCMRPR